MSGMKTQTQTQASTDRIHYRTLSYEEAKELLLKGDYKYLVGWSEFEAYAKFYCRQADGELECVRIWRNGRTGGKGGKAFRGTAEEVYAWIVWDCSGMVSPVEVKRSIRSAFGVEIDQSKIDRAYRSMLDKVLGV